MWKIEWRKPALKQLTSLDSQIRKRIRQAVEEKLHPAPDQHLIPLVGDLSSLCKFRVDDCRLLCLKEDDVLIITVIKVKHRKEVYERKKIYLYL